MTQNLKIFNRKSKSIAGLLLCFMLLLNSIVTFADETTHTVTINQTDLTFDTIIHVDAIDGDDSTGDGSEAKPYKTLAQAITAYDGFTAFVMGAGTYESVNINDRKYDTGIAFIGSGEDTTFKITGTLTITGNGAPTFHGKAYFYNLVWDGDNLGGTNYMVFHYDPVYFNNVVFKNIPNVMHGYLIFELDGSCFLYNCIKTASSSDFLRSTPKQIQMTNCYGPFTFGYKTTQEECDYQTNLITTEAANLDANYNILDSGWANAGTGTNPDGTVANIGVYGGAFSWDGLTISTSTNTQHELDIVSEKDKIHVGEEVLVDVVINSHNALYAEDVKLTYDTSLFEYVGYENVEGLKVYNEAHDASTGALRFIIASQGKDHPINDGDTILKLKLKGKAPGEGLVDAIAGRIADISTETDIDSAQCGADTIIIEEILDVNKSGEFTLLDLAIDGYYFNDFASVDTTVYNTDLDTSGEIDDADLSAIVAEMLANTNYLPNN